MVTDIESTARYPKAFSTQVQPSTIRWYPDCIPSPAMRTQSEPLGQGCKSTTYRVVIFLGSSGNPYDVHYLYLAKLHSGLYCSGGDINGISE